MWKIFNVKRPQTQIVMAKRIKASELLGKFDFPVEISTWENLGERNPYSYDFLRFRLENSIYFCSF